MPSSLSITNIPAPRVPLIDDRTGLMSREWYRFFLNLFNLTGDGNNPTSLEDLQLGPAFEFTPDMFAADNLSPDANSSLTTLSMSVSDLGQSLQTLPVDFGGTVSSVAQTFTGGLISVGGSPITTSGTLALTVAGTPGGVPYFTSASTWASSALLAANALVVGGGAGLAPATVTTGANVVTALGVAVGTAGSFVVNGGALGTPSSGTVTNLTGTASININGTVGATTANTGAFTSLSYTTTLTGGTGIVNLGSGQFYKDASGNVGIGTSSPVQLLDVNGTIRARANGAEGGQIEFNNPDNASQGAVLDVSTAEVTRWFTVRNNSTHQIGQLVGTGGTISLYTAAAERFRIDSSGNTLNVGAGGLGYGTGSGGAVTQITSRTTGVTLNKTNGAVTMFSAAGSAAAATFTVTNSTVAATDTIILSVKSSTNVYLTFVTAVAAGSFNVTFQTTGGIAVDAPVINFAVIKAVVA